MKKPKPKRKPKRKPDIAVATITMLTLERQALRDGLRDLLRFYDILSGHVGELGVGWTYADIKRLEEIRGLVTRNS